LQDMRKICVKLQGLRNIGSVLEHLTVTLPSEASFPESVLNSDARPNMYVIVKRLSMPLQRMEEFEVSSSIIPAK
jgi:hypothetical protein